MNKKEKRHEKNYVDPIIKYLELRNENSSYLYAGGKMNNPVYITYNSFDLEVKDGQIGITEHMKVL